MRQSVYWPRKLRAETRATGSRSSRRLATPTRASRAGRRHGTPQAAVRCCGYTDHTPRPFPGGRSLLSPRSRPAVRCGRRHQAACQRHLYDTTLKRPGQHRGKRPGRQADAPHHGARREICLLPWHSPCHVSLPRLATVPPVHSIASPARATTGNRGHSNNSCPKRGLPTGSGQAGC